MKKVFTLFFIFLSFLIVGFSSSSLVYADTSFTFGTNASLKYFNSTVFVLNNSPENKYLYKQSESGEFEEFIKGYKYNATTSLNFVNPVLFTVTENRVLIYDNFKRIIVFSLSGDTLFYATEYPFLDKIFDLNGISDACFDTNNNIYLIDSINQNIVLLENSITSADQIKTLDISEDIEITASSKIICDLYDNLYLVNQEGIYIINATNGTLTDTLEVSLEYDNIEIDYVGNIYTYKKSENKILRYSLDNLENPAELILTEEFFDSFSFNKLSGEIFYLSEGIFDRTTLLDEDNKSFVLNLSGFTKPTNYLTATALTSAITLASITNDTIGYNHPYPIGEGIVLTLNDYVYILGEQDNYYYCLITNKSNFLITTYIKKNFLVVVPNTAEEVQMSVMNNIPVIYKYPSSVKQTSDIDNPLILQTNITTNQIVTVTRKLINYPDSGGIIFYEIVLSSQNGVKTYGYITENSLTSFLPTPPAQSLKTNAEVKVANESEVVNIYSENEEIIGQITSKTRIKIAEFDKSKKYTFVEFLDEEEQIQTGYILTKNIKPDGVEIEYIIAIILFAVCGVFAIILFATNRKNR